MTRIATVPRIPLVAGLAAVLAAVLLTGAVATGMLARPATRTPQGAEQATSTTANPKAAGLAPGAAADPAVAFPTVLRIPAIGVSTPLVRLGLDASGALQAPESPDVAGWFAGGPVPGDLGPAVLAGHVDSKVGPAVFFRLRQLKAGEEILVERSDGSTVAFSVATVQVFPKDQFPTEQVYRPTPLAELRLVTCGGPFDRAGGRYLDNVVVEAVSVGT